MVSIREWISIVGISVGSLHGVWFGRGDRMPGPSFFLSIHTLASHESSAHPAPIHCPPAPTQYPASTRPMSIQHLFSAQTVTCAPHTTAPCRLIRTLRCAFTAVHDTACSHGPADRCARAPTPPADVQSHKNMPKARCLSDAECFVALEACGRTGHEEAQASRAWLGGPRVDTGGVVG